MSAVAAIRARAHEYDLRSKASLDASEIDHDEIHATAAVSFATVAIALYEIAEALEQDGDE